VVGRACPLISLLVTVRPIQQGTVKHLICLSLITGDWKIITLKYSPNGIDIWVLQPLPPLAARKPGERVSTTQIPKEPIIAVRGDCSKVGKDGF
jgi:hypothetical protein